jgi:single-stranded-DNA-specific exonuclease
VSANPPFLGVAQSLSGRAWRLRAADDRLALAHAQRLGVPELVGRLLAGRDVTLDDASAFLNPTLRALIPDPSSFADMDVAADRLVRAIVSAESVAVFGDYDVDGATSSSLLKRYLAALGRPLRVYIPNRISEGYGPNPTAMRSLAGEGIKLVVTVDCGTLAHAALEEAHKAGLDVIVVDHHTPGPTLPRAVAVINPNRVDDRSGAGQLAAVGVAFMLTAAVNRLLRQRGWFSASRPEPDLMRLLDLVALGTVCDVVPLTGINRALVAQGLKVMNGWRNTGLRALATVAGLTGGPGVYDLGFLLGPRINAAGRMASADIGVHLLTSEDDEEARGLAFELDARNRERQSVEAIVLDDAIADATRRGVRPGLVAAAGDSFHPGVIGIVAGRLRERFGLPSFVFSTDGAMAKGSARSIPGVDTGGAVHAALAEGLLVSGGGHAMAAGLTVACELLEDALAFLNSRLSPQVAAASGARDIVVDGTVLTAGATVALVDTISRVGPFGAGNPEPVFALAGIRVVQADLVGRDHVRCIGTDDSGGRVKAIAFRAAEDPFGQMLLKSGGRPLHLAGKLKRDDWNGEKRVQLYIDDVAVAA